MTRNFIHEVKVTGRRVRRFRFASPAFEHFLGLELEEGEDSVFKRYGKKLATRNWTEDMTTLHGARAANLVDRLAKFNCRKMQTHDSQRTATKTLEFVTFSPREELPKIKRTIRRNYRVGNFKKIRTYQNEEAALKRFLTSPLKAQFLQDDSDVIAMKMDKAIMLHGRKRLTAFRHFVFRAGLLTRDEKRVIVRHRVRSSKSWVYFVEVEGKA